VYSPSQCRGDDCHAWIPVDEKVSMLPMGAFLVTVDNTTDKPIVVQPKDFSLQIGNKTDKALASADDVGLRWERTVSRTIGYAGGTDLQRPLWAAEDDLAIMNGKVTIAPHSARSGYVVFDIGAYTPADYAKALRNVKQVEVQLKSSAGQASATLPLDNA
jgi:hypothetical protein